MEIANAHHREVRDQALATGKHSVAPRRVRVTYSLTVNAGCGAGRRDGARLAAVSARDRRASRKTCASSRARRRSTSIAPESALQRTVYLEQARRRRASPRTFSITYELTVFGQYHAIDRREGRRRRRARRELAPYLAERPPHIVFTPAIRKFSREIVGDEKNPYRIAQKLFAAVDRIPWAGAREYSTISNISDYALHAGHARLRPADAAADDAAAPQRHSRALAVRLGLSPTASYDNMHDWGRLYLAPYGWVPMDVTFGRLQSGDPQIDGFYLGGLDAYRIAFNDDFSQPFVPAKQHFRSETVDSQRGEVEWRGGNLYFDQWDYEFEAHVLTVSNGGERSGSRGVSMNNKRIIERWPRRRSSSMASSQLAHARERRRLARRPRQRRATRAP